MARKYEGHAIGIDLGTTNSRIAVWQEQNNRAEIIYNEASFVAFTDDRRWLIGNSAKNQAASNPSNTVFDVKKFLGRKYSDPIIQNNLLSWPFRVISSKDDKPMIRFSYKDKEKHLSPEEILALIFKKMMDTVKAFLKSPVKNAVITVPAYFNDSQQKAINDAAVNAGLNVKGLINEPTAAAISYGLHKRATCVENRNILVVDLGGGTFDVSLITFKDGKFEIKAARNTQFGGEDFNERMMNHFVKEFKREHKSDISRNSRALRRLRTACERAKNALSFYSSTFLVEDIYDGLYFFSSITSAKFEQLNINLFDTFMNIIKVCLFDAKINNSSVDEVVLVGGSSRIPKVRQLLQNFFKKGKNIFDIIGPDEVVACGATIHAALLSGSLKNVPKEVHQYLTRLSLAELEPEPIPRNIVNHKRVKLTIEDNSSKIMIDFQGGVGITLNVPGSFDVSLPDTALALPINCCFATDSDGMLNVSTEVQTISKDIKITNENVRVEFRSIDHIIRPQMATFDNARDVIQDICCKENATDAGKVAVMVWVLWNNWNNWIWNEDKKDANQLGAQGYHMWQEWFLAQGSMGNETNRIHYQTTWRPPQPGTTNGGWCVRDGGGRFIVAGTSWNNGRFSIVEVEAIALKEAIQGAINLNLQNIIFESDSQLVVQATHATSPGNSEYNMIINSIQNLLNSRDDFEVKFVKHQANYWSRRAVLYLIPPCIEQYLFNEMN
ncbi:heat shock 70 kDa protein 18-like [Vicia villosa]|uniref:heat shock 70 kDa protein 18-like n=1 Tax=Vicia villosa TaxID=3911 RepID=UPI00273ADFC5|nr:heat shock 70 kDa protein 18-like [Vicia villosa]